MDAAGDPLRPARPSEGEDKPKPPEPQDDGYETSNSGEQRPKPSSTEGSPLPPTEPPIPQQAPPQPHPEPDYNLMRYPPQYRPYEQEETYQHFPFPKYNDYQFKRENEAPYDMSQYKREDMYNGGVKRECEDPYSFVEEDMCAMLGGPQGQMAQHYQHHPQNPLQHPHMQMHPQQMILNQPKKRGRKKKVKDENGMEIKLEPGMDGVVVPRPVKERKKHDRFNGMSEEEVSRRTLPDHLAENLDIIIIGINPGLFAAYKGHHYAGPGNHFWKCLYLSGLTREQMSADEDYKLLNFGIGFTNMVPRATKGSADLTRREIKEGSAVLLEKLQTFRPKVAVFNGKLIYEVFSGKKDFSFGKQPDTIAGTNTYMWVMPSSSARCAQLPRAADKVPFYAALKKFRDYLNGLLPHIEESELVFPDNTSRRPQDELEIRRLTMEPEPGDTIILEDGTEVPLKKKRGRPKKVKLENGETAPPTPRAPRAPRAAPVIGPDGEVQPAKKKRGRPKKIRPEEQAFLLQQQQQQQAQQQQSQAMMPAHDSQYMHQQQEGQFSSEPLPPAPALLYGAGGGAPDSNYYQPPAPAALEAGLDMGRGFGSPGGNTVGNVPVGNVVPAYCERVYSPRDYRSPASGYSPRHSDTPQPQGQPQYPGSPGFAPSPPRAFGSPARAPLYNNNYNLYERQDAQPVPRPYSRSPVPTVGPVGPVSGVPSVGPGAVGSVGVSPSYAGSPACSAHSSPAPPPNNNYPSPHHFNNQTPQSTAVGSLGGEMGSLSPPASPLPLDFDPPEHHSRPCSPDIDDYNKSNSVGSEMSVGAASAVGGSTQPFSGTQDVYNKEHYHYTQEQGSAVAGSPRLEQLHQHPSMYSNNFNRSTPPTAGSPFGSHAAFRPPDHPHTPHTPNTMPGSPGGEFPAKSKPVDVSSKSLSGLESLVDQIPSIAEGTVEPPQHLAEFTPPIYPSYPPYTAPPYANNGYGAPFVGYGGGWGSQLMRPTPGYLPDWQYPYPATYPYNTPYYNYPPAHQQYLSSPAILDLHKNQDSSVPSVPSVPSVGFGPFC